MLFRSPLSIHPFQSFLPAETAFRNMFLLMKQITIYQHQMCSFSVMVLFVLQLLTEYLRFRIRTYLSSYCSIKIVEYNIFLSSYTSFSGSSINLLRIHLFLNPLTLKFNVAVFSIYTHLHLIYCNAFVVTCQALFCSF